MLAGPFNRVCSALHTGVQKGTSRRPGGLLRWGVLNWLKKHRASPPDEVAADPDVNMASGRRKAGKYRSLYEYLEQRYAQTVVLTFAEIESLLGFALPDAARTDQDWWTVAAQSVSEPRCSPAWTLASRTAKPNLVARTVTFERISSVRISKVGAA